MTSFTHYARELRKDQILSAAEQVLRERGLSQATVDEIARVAGIAKGTVYLHFGSKEALVDAVVGHACRRVSDLMFSPGEAGTPSVPLESSFKRLVLTLTTRTSDAPPRWLMISHLLDDPHSHECPVLRGLTEALRQAMSDGDVPQRCSPELGALTLIGLAVAAATHWRGKATDENAGDELWRFFARGSFLPNTPGGIAVAEEPRAGGSL